MHSPSLPPQSLPPNAKAVLTAENLSKHYPLSGGLFKAKVLVKALDGVSFTLAAAKTLAVVGESGCGKSTLARLLTRVETPTAGKLWLDGEELAVKVSVADEKRRRQKIQMVFQNPFASLNPRQKIAQIIEEPLVINTALTRSERQQMAMAMLAKVGLRPEHYYRYPHMFSGGQRQRIAIGRALILKPKVLVADEPVSALDVSIQAQVLNLLMDLQEEMGVAYLFISHNLSVVELIADDIAVMYLGRFVEVADKYAMMNNPLHPYTQALLASTPRIHARDRKARKVLSGELPSPLSPPQGCAFHPRCPLAEEQCRQTPPPLIPKQGRLIACHKV